MYMYLIAPMKIINFNVSASSMTIFIIICAKNESSSLPVNLIIHVHAINLYRRSRSQIKSNSKVAVWHLVLTENINRMF